ncbi:MFS transporter [Aspergillus taichungensis]|uniref:MFS transporter n=1 Tax=Aspergillus taichungensis TaxID=482145 RepID=A0A2J5I0Q1_9EURO|nr:MFS transporter [Aspergillus taichungensis]
MTMTLVPHDPRDAEDAPFLPSTDSASNSNASPWDRKERKEPHAIDPNLRLRLMVTLFAMVLAIEVGIVMAGGPMTQIYESITCREFYARTDPSQIGPSGYVEESQCKLKEVQSELAAVKGYMEFFDGILSIFLAIPYGLMADRSGRKPTIMLSIPGFFLNCLVNLVVIWYSDVLPLRAVWASSLAWLIGGGPVVAFAVAWTMMSDVTTEEERAPMFFKFGVASMGADFVTSLASSWLMAMNPWIPLLAGWSIVVGGVCLALTLPETMHTAHTRAPSPSPSIELSRWSHEDLESHTRRVSKEPNSDDWNDFENPKEGETRHPRGGPDSTPPPLIVKLAAQCRAYLTPYSFIFRNKHFMLLLSAFLVYRLSRGSSWFLVQYISTRYHWTLAQANFLMSWKPALTIPLFLWVLPAISQRLLRTMKTNQKDLYLARVSIIFLIVGTLGIGLSPTVATLIPSLITQTAGAGFVFLTRALVTTLVRREETARLFTMIEVLQSVGNVVASLSITAVFQIGLEMGGVWIGLAWMMTSTAFTLVGLAIWLFRLPPSPVEDGHFDDL